MHIKWNNHHGYLLGCSYLLPNMYIFVCFSCIEDETSLIYEQNIYASRTDCCKMFSLNACFWNQLMHTWYKIRISPFHLVSLLYEVCTCLYLLRGRVSCMYMYLHCMSDACIPPVFHSTQKGIFSEYRLTFSPVS